MVFKLTACRTFLLCIFGLRISKVNGLQINGSDEYKLRREILENMDVMVRPVKSRTDVVNVSFSLVVRSLNDLDNKRQVLATSVWISQKWHNPFLEWNKEKHGGIEYIHVSPSEIWVPDIILYNNSDKQVIQAGHTEFFKSWVVLHSNGTCAWDAPANLQSACDIDISSFPFDKQTCSLSFGSVAYGSELLRIHLTKTAGHEKSETEGNGEWRIEKTYQEVYSGQRPMSLRKYSFINYTLTIERQWIYYTMFLILPCVVCTVLVLFSFALPPENGERIGFCSTIMISVSVFLLLIADMLPEKSDNLPILGIYYTITMVEIACVLVATILVLRAYHSTSEPPACCKALYRMCKGKRKKKILNTTGTKFKMRKLLNRNVVDSELTPVENVAESVSPPSRPSAEHTPIVKTDCESNEEENRKIWRAIAVSLDRLFFWLFMLTFLASSAYLVAVKPDFVINGDGTIGVP